MSNWIILVVILHGVTKLVHEATKLICAPKS